MNKIKEILNKKNLPTSPGVYKMLDINNQIIYIGKAKNLKNRLISYTNKNQNLKNYTMLSLVENIEFIQTKTEIHALLLEAVYIKDIQPKYNIVLKDDKSFSYIYFSNSKFPSITIQKKFKENTLNNKKQEQTNINSSFFGPFYNKLAAKKMLEIIKNTFKIRDCKDSVFKNRNKPCMEYYINKCTAPCVNKISEEDYKTDLTNAKNLLQGDKNLIKNYKSQMLTASKEENYILAKSLQEKIKFLEELSIKSSSKYNNFDIITYIEKDNKIIICYAIHRGSILMDKVFNIINKDDNFSNNISNDVENFYKKNKTPEIIFLSKQMINLTFQQN